MGATIQEKNSYPKPRVVISKCIEFDHCRYNAQIISSEQVKELKDFIDFHPICPEFEIGLGIPRDPIRIIQEKSQKRLYQPATSRDVTDDMNAFSKNFLSSLSEVDGFILKTRSPSCGIKEVKVYPQGEKVAPIDKGPGFFGGQVLQCFPHLPIEDEGRLRNPTIREHFLRTIFTFSRFRKIKKEPSLKELINFHSQHKFMLMAYDQHSLQQMGQIVAHQEKQEIDVLLQNYEKKLYQVFQKAPRCTANINVLMHAYGYFKGKVTQKEREYFLSLLEGYRNGKLSLATVTGILTSWIIRFDEAYLQDQYFFTPYPKELVHPENIDSCFSKQYWKEKEDSI